MSADAHAAPLDDVDRRQAQLPPVTLVATGTLVLLVSGGIYMAAQINHSATLVVPTVLAVAAGLALLTNVALLARIKEFAWASFFLVFKWALLAYAVIAGILEFVFVYDKTPGHQLALFSVMLVIFALNVPVLLAYSVARYQPVPEATA
jgi:hypothetical protein